VGWCPLFIGGFRSFSTPYFSALKKKHEQPALGWFPA